MGAWAQDNAGLLVGAVVAVAGLLFVGRRAPGLVASIPVDYFTHETKPPDAPSAGNPAVKVLRGLLGILFIVAGIAMLVLPGPGTVTILAGILMIEFPGKYELEKKIVRKPAVLKSLNEIREKAGVPPLQS